MPSFDAARWQRSLDIPWLGNRTASWLTALAVTLLLLLAAAIVRRVAQHRLNRAMAAAWNPAQEVVLALLHRTRWVLLLVPAVYLGALALDLPERTRGVVRSLAVITVLFQVALWATVALEMWVSRERRRRLAVDVGSATVFGSLSFLLRLLLWVLIVLIALENLGINVSALVTGLGVGGIAVALALQNILGDVLASLSITFDKPFVLGDRIQVDTLVGTVEDVGLKTTRLRSPAGEQLIFANGDLLKSRIHNLSRQQARHLTLAFSVDAAATADQLEKIPPQVAALVAARADVRLERVHLKGFDKGTFDFEVAWVLAKPDYTVYMDHQQAILLGILRVLADTGVSLAGADRPQWIAIERPASPGAADAPAAGDAADAAAPAAGNKRSV